MTRFHQEEIQEITEYKARAEQIIRRICVRQYWRAASVQLQSMIENVISSDYADFEGHIDLTHVLFRRRHMNGYEKQYHDSRRTEGEPEIKFDCDWKAFIDVQGLLEWH